MRRKFPSWVLQAFGYGISAACLVWVLHGYQVRELIPDIRSLDFRWVLLAVSADLSVYVSHGWRWNTLLSPVVRLRLWRTVQAIYIGLFANEVLPLRTGELIRCYLLAHWNNLRLSLSLASAVVERVIDGFWLIAMFFITAGFVRHIPRDLVFLVRIVGVLILAAAICLAWIVIRKQDAHAAIAESRWASSLRHVIEGLHLMGGVRSLGLAMAISLFYVFLQVVSLWALMKAYGLDLSFWAAGGILTIIRLAIIVPNAPGNLGLMQVACVLALGLFEVERDVAKTFSFILFFAWTVPLLIVGAVATALTGLNLGELHDHAKRAHVARHVAPAPEKP